MRIVFVCVIDVKKKETERESARTSTITKSILQTIETISGSSNEQKAKRKMKNQIQKSQ